MDRQTLALFIPILALSIPVLAIVSSGLQKVWRLRIEEARVRAGALAQGAEAELDQLRGELEQVRHELAEVQERLDFTERLLARKADPSPLPGAPQSPGK